MKNPLKNFDFKGLFKNRWFSILLFAALFAIMFEAAYLASSSVTKVLNNQNEIAEIQKEESNRLEQLLKDGEERDKLLIKQNEAIQCLLNAIVGGVPEADQERCKRIGVEVSQQATQFRISNMSRTTVNPPGQTNNPGNSQPGTPPPNFGQCIKILPLSICLDEIL